MVGNNVADNMDTIFAIGDVTGRIMTSSILKLTRDPSNVLGPNSGLDRARTKMKTDLESL